MINCFSQTDKVWVFMMIRGIMEQGLRPFMWVESLFDASCETGTATEGTVPRQVDLDIGLCIFLSLLSFTSISLAFTPNLSSSSREGWAIGLDLPQLQTILTLSHFLCSKIGATSIRAKQNLQICPEQKHFTELYRQCRVSHNIISVGKAMLMNCTKKTSENQGHARAKQVAKDVSNKMSRACCCCSVTKGFHTQDNDFRTHC